MIASIEEPIPALVARDFVVQLTSAKELGLVESTIPLMIVSFRGLDPDGDVATWSVVLDQDHARDLTSILAGAILGSLPTSSRRRRRFVRPRSRRIN